LDADTLENLEELNITIGQLDVEKPSTKEANVRSTTTMTLGLVGALGGKVRPTYCYIHDPSFEDQMVHVKVDN
jgi:hypothetical protein